MKSKDTQSATDFFDPNDIETPASKSTQNDDTDNSGKPTSRKRNSRKTAREEKSGPNPIIAFFKDRRTRIFVGVLLVCTATYLFISALSYFTSGADDQSSVMNLTVEQMTQSGHRISNQGGVLGASFSHNFISNGLGLGTLVLIAYFFIIGWRMLHRKPFNFIGLTLRTLILSITVSVVAGLLTFNLKSWIYWGGIHGYEINNYLMRLTGFTGTVIVSVCLSGLIVAVYFNELRLIYVRYRRRMIARALQKRRIAEEKAERRALADEGLQKSDESLKISATTDDNNNDNANQSTINTPLAFDNEFLGSTISADNADRYSTPPPSDTSLHTTEQEQENNEIAEPDDTVPETEYVNDNEEPESSVPDNEASASDTDTTLECPGITVTVNEVEEAHETDNELFDPTATLSRYVAPSIDLLSDTQLKGTTVDQDEMEKNKLRITETLGKYDIPIVHIEATVGPTVTLYEIVPDDGVRIARVKRLEDDIAMSLSAKGGIRIIAPIPGKGSIGIEVPNLERQLVSSRTVFGSRKFQECNDMELPLAMGATISRDIYISDLAKMPHLLVAGATGTGKSVGLNIIIASLLFKKHPSELKFVLIDPKMVEFSLYAKLERHFLAKLPDEEDPIITEPAKAAATLNSLCIEMENRYKLLKDAGVRNIKEYNEKFVHRRLSPDRGHNFMPYIVVIVDEFGDLFMLAGKDVENPIARIAQKARAVGIHMILATQRPSADIVKGFIKTNFPARMAFQVASRVDSMTILDRPGAQGLIGKGDMLISILSEVERVQCAFISTDEVGDMVESIDNQIGYPEPYLLPEYNPNGDAVSESSHSSLNTRDALFEEVARFIVSAGSTASTSMLQRRYSIGYNRAGKLMDQMEQAGIVGPALGAKPRAVLMDPLQLERFLEIPLAE